MKKPILVDNHIAKPGEAKRKIEYSRCPQCGLKGLYNVRQRYSRCRYCGLYRISSQESQTG
ncbi:MAG: hypothetical protein JXA51_07530 [Dehalococcoidales bacterium]|nr:hypothetical protein [Dehalococcoidales bacterium]